jgi:hypothetical protein
MSRVKVIAVLLVVSTLAAACTSGTEDTSTTSAPSTTIAPVTTLATTTTSTSSTTTLPPTTTTTTEPLPTNDCVVGPNSSVEGYTQGCTVLGTEILAGEAVESGALDQMSDRIYNMLVLRPDLQSAINAAGIDGRVIDANQRITDLPEYVDLYNFYPGTDWDRRGRSYPGIDLIPFIAGAEENLLCFEKDFYAGEDAFIRDFALTIRRFGMTAADPQTDARIEQAYGTAIAKGLWINTLTEIDSDNYWQEGVQSFFDVNLEEPEDRPPNSSHNHVDTRDELRAYDTTLWEIAVSVFGNTDWRPSCP